MILGQYKSALSARHRKMMRKKGHMVLRILENRLTSILLLQAINKLLTQARTKEKTSQLISSSNFQKFIRSVTGKDISDLLGFGYKF